MEDVFLEKINSFDTLIICDIDIKDDLINAPLRYLSGSFKVANLKDYKTFQEILDSINPHGEVCEGYGYIEYKKLIINSINTLKKEDKNYSFILPLMEKELKRNFLLNINKTEKAINFLFVYFNEESGLSHIDEYVAGSYKDRLTGLFNYNTLIKHLSGKIESGFLCLFDLNKFKAINDTYGHSIGDEVLFLTASFMISISSSSEIFYRRSGDEFMILFLEHNLDYAKSVIYEIAEYLRRIPAVSLKQYPGLECSASFGLVEIIPEQKEIDYLTSIKLTDLAMYQAKKANKTIHYISYEDSLQIMKQGELENRLQALAKSKKTE